MNRQPLIQRSLPPTHVVPLAELKADFTVGPQVAKPEGFMKTHALVVGQRNARKCCVEPLSGELP